MASGQPLLKLLPGMEVLGAFPQKVQSQIADQAHRRVYQKGEVLFRQGDNWRFVFYLHRGLLRSVITSFDGQAHTVSTWDPGEVFWSHSLLDEEPMPSTMEALKESVVYIWEGELLINYLLDSPPAVRALLRRQTQLIRKRRQKIHDLAFATVAGRLAKFIIESFGSAESGTITRDLTLDEMASIVSTSPVVVCRILHEFQSQGILKINRTSISLNDWEALEKLAIQRDE